jgi:two-component system, cell cycle response regulator
MNSNQPFLHPSDRQAILVVEDSPTQAMRTRIALEKAGFRVSVAATGADALAAVRRSEPDLILLDVRLPDMNGREVAQQLKTDPLFSGIPLIFLTGVYRDVSNIIDGLGDGADDYLVKPIEDIELIARVNATLRSRRMQRELAQLARMLYTVSQVGQQLATIHNLSELLDSVVCLINQSFDYPHVHVYLRQGNELVLAAAANVRSPQALAQFPRVAIDADCPSATAARTGRLQLLTRQRESKPTHPLLAAVRSGIAAPILSPLHAGGVLEIASPNELAFSPHDQLVLQTLADLVGVALQNSKMYQELKSLATFDALTGLLNRRSILAQLDAELLRSQTLGQNLAVLMADIDGFKQVNDLYGHQSGDIALQAVSHLIQTTIRRNDLAGRVGGEEFLIVLPETDQQGAELIAERLRSACELMLIDVGPAQISLTLSLGVVSWLETAALTAADLIQKSDRALYHAKSIGRNKVMVASGERGQSNRLLTLTKPALKDA